MIRAQFPLAALLMCGSLAGGPSALAQVPEPDAAQNGRYSMTPAGDGFLRLDTRTGATSLCRRTGDGVQCRAAAEDRSALQAEIDRLASENEGLRKKLAAATGQSPGQRLRNALPTDEEVDKAMGWMENFMRRMMRLMKEEQVEGKDKL